MKKKFFQNNEIEEAEAFKEEEEETEEEEEPWFWRGLKHCQKTRGSYTWSKQCFKGIFECSKIRRI